MREDKNNLHNKHNLPALWLPGSCIYEAQVAQVKAINLITGKLREVSSSQETPAKIKAEQEVFLLHTSSHLLFFINVKSNCDAWT